MPVIIWVLIGLAIVALAALLLSVVVYIRQKASLSPTKSTLASDDTDNILDKSDVSSGVLGLLTTEMVVAQSLIQVPSTHSEQSVDFSAADAELLSIWLVFLALEYDLIENDVLPERVEPHLERFSGVLDKLHQASEVDLLLKKLATHKAELKHVSETFSSLANDVAEQMRKTSRLNLDLDKLQLKRDQDAELDKKLDDVRQDIAVMCEVEGRIRQQLETLKLDDVADSDYQRHLEDFLATLEPVNFLDAMQAELTDKLTELQETSLAQATLIKDLQRHVKNVRDDMQNHKTEVEYDILIARIEKTLLERSRLVKSLERKLSSLQAIKYNLNVDIKKRDDILAQKDKQLQQLGLSDSGAIAEIKGIFERKHESIRTMQDLLQDVPLTEQSEIYAAAQNDKVASLRLMVTESELYVEMLERDLDESKTLKEQLEQKILHMEVELEVNSKNRQAFVEQEQMQALQQMNEDIEGEIERLKQDLYSTSSEHDDQKMQSEIAEITRTIDALRADYVRLEEKYLMTLIS